MGVLHKTKARAAEHHATMTAPSLVASTSPGRNTSKYPRFGKRGAPQAFPSKLYEILEGENPDIVGWTDTGRGFEVRLCVLSGRLLSPSTGGMDLLCLTFPDPVEREG